MRARSRRGLFFQEGRSKSLKQTSFIVHFWGVRAHNKFLGTCPRKRLFGHVSLQPSFNMIRWQAGLHFDELAREFMVILHINHRLEQNDRHRVVLTLDAGDKPSLQAEATFTFSMTPREDEDLRWYYEEYVLFQEDPTPLIAARIERWMVDTGTQLFRDVFDQEATRHVWSTLAPQLGETRVEIDSDMTSASGVPWELLRDPSADNPIALLARAFVYGMAEFVDDGQHEQELTSRAEGGKKSGPLRILLVVCRPGRGSDVPFRSIAGRIVNSAEDRPDAPFQTKALRPPTFALLAGELKQAAQRGTPYDVVHFDGHGIFADLMARATGQPPKRERGYVVFENPGTAENEEFVDGAVLGRTLADNGVSVLVLNACRSAQAQPSAVPGKAPAQDRKRPFGSLAQEALAAGLAGVVAMRYNVHVSTAARFVAGLYADLAAGSMLGDAVTSSRRKLASAPRGDAAHDPPIQDWLVPVAYEPTPLSLATTNVSVPLGAGTASDVSAPPEGGLPVMDAAIPPPPKAGLVGFDSELLTIDRAFDTHHVVLVHALAGAGKTALAAEFARWYARTGGLPDGLVLWTGFERHCTLVDLLDQAVEGGLGTVLKRQAVDWLTLDDAARLRATLWALAQISVLWIWDNIEPIAGFPSPADSPWSDAERGELIGFLREAAKAGAKILLTSRRDEQELLGDLPVRVSVAPLSRAESAEIARTLGSDSGADLPGPTRSPWNDLIDFAGGNPLTLTIVVKQAISDPAHLSEQQAGYRLLVDSATSGESGDRSTSLGASLRYGFDGAFTDLEREQLAVLHLFRKYVTVYEFDALGYAHAPWYLDSLRGIASNALFAKAASVGLLSSMVPHVFAIHPALSWFLAEQFSAFYPAEPKDDGSRADRARAAYTRALARWASEFSKNANDGNAKTFYNILIEEPNLRHALSIAQSKGWSDTVIDVMQGLRVLYTTAGRWATWQRLVDEITPSYVNAVDDEPREGFEITWAMINDYRVELARRLHDFERAERLQQRKIQWSQVQAGASVAVDAAAPEDPQTRAQLLTFAVDTAQLAEILRDRENPECVSVFTEAMRVYTKLGEQHGQAVTALNLARAYHDIAAVHDKVQAKTWYLSSLRLRKEDDLMGRAMCLGNLGQLALEYVDAGSVERDAQGNKLFVPGDAEGYLGNALSLFPNYARRDRAIVHNAMGALFSSKDQPDIAVQHFIEASRLFDEGDDTFEAAGSRFNAAYMFAELDNVERARAYAESAARLARMLGPGGAGLVEQANQLLSILNNPGV